MFTARVIRKGNARSRGSAEARIRRLKTAAADMRSGLEAQVGFPVGTDPGIAETAFYNEFGTSGSGEPFVTTGKGGAKIGGFGGPVPERPFIREGIRAAKGDLKRVGRQAAKDIVHDKITVHEALDKLGVEGQGAIQDSITDGAFAPNAPLTVAIKGSNTPLVNTGQMRWAVSYRVGKRSS